MERRIIMGYLAGAALLGFGFGLRTGNVALMVVFLVAFFFWAFRLRQK